MDDPVGVQILQRIDDLHSVTFNLKLMEPLPPFEELVHALIMAELQKDVYIVAVLEKMHKLSYVGMLHRSVNLDLTHELLLSSTPLERGLLDNLGSSDCFGFALNEFIAFCKSTLAEEFSLHILSIGDFSILMLDPLFNDLGGRTAWLA